MKKHILFWIIAVVVTLAAAYYQRVTGPTYPISGQFNFADKTYNYKFDRSHGGDTDNKVSVEIDDQSVTGVLQWKRYKTNDEWHEVEMKNEGGTLTGFLPHQPPAGKLLYRVILKSENEERIIPSEPVIIRFKGEVPLFILIPHVIFIFGAMLLSNRTALECFVEKPNLKKYTLWTFGNSYYWAE